MRGDPPELGVYVLGAIAPADRAVVSRHPASCPRCREEVAGLTGLPALLRKVPVADAMQLPGNARPITPGRRKRSWWGWPGGRAPFAVGVDGDTRSSRAAAASVYISRSRMVTLTRLV